MRKGEEKRGNGGERREERENGGEWREETEESGAKKIDDGTEKGVRC